LRGRATAFAVLADYPVWGLRHMPRRGTLDINAAESTAYINDGDSLSIGDVIHFSGLSIRLLS
jgi:hypothetical protein